jgi:hypothetical protein|tara:strand:+ start:183 stop:698 length:516 start_codon:yes stop_codon:yes gene_type:complete
MKITLTDREFKFVEMLARGRHFLKDIVMPDRKLIDWNNTQSEADILGVMGEYAVSKYLSIPMDTEVNLQGDGGEVDLWLGDWSIQVKSTKYDNGRLVFNSKDEMKALIDVLTICNIQKQTVNIVGYISNKDLQQKMYEKDLGFGVRYCIDQDDLKDISWLVFYYLEWKKAK